MLFDRKKKPKKKSLFLSSWPDTRRVFSVRLFTNEPLVMAIVPYTYGSYYPSYGYGYCSHYSYPRSYYSSYAPSYYGYGCHGGYGGYGGYGYGGYGCGTGYGGYWWWSLLASVAQNIVFCSHERNAWFTRCREKRTFLWKIESFALVSLRSGSQRTHAARKGPCEIEEEEYRS